MSVRFLEPPSTPLEYPLHYAIRDKTCSEEDTMAIIKAAYATHPGCIGEPDSTGLRPITIAIMVENLTAINTLLELAAPAIAQGDDPLGLQIPDEEQETPLSYNVRLLRESPRFVIHDLLDGASRDVTAAYIERKLPGCTCKKCTSKWLSSKMRFRLRGA